MKPSGTTVKRITSSASAHAMLADVDYVLLDVDGVLVGGNRVLPGVPEALSQLRRLGKKLRVVTNNSTRPIPTLVRHFSNLGLSFDASEIVSSANATANYLARLAPQKPFDKGNVFCLGSPGLYEDIKDALNKTTKNNDNNNNNNNTPAFVYGPELNPASTHAFGEVIRSTDLNKCAHAIHHRILPPPQDRPELGDQSIDSLDVSCVVIGLDPSFTLTKLAIANLALRHRPDCLFVVTNSDPQFSINYTKPDGSLGMALLPGGGSQVAALKTAAGRTCDVEIGKPHRFMFDVICEREKAPGEDAAAFARRCVMVGDRLTTDVLFGQRAGTKTLFVLSGCEDEAGIESTGIVPDFCAPSLGAVGQFLADAAATARSKL